VELWCWLLWQVNVVLLQIYFLFCMTFV
jgi:hypothetical protein